MSICSTGISRDAYLADGSLKPLAVTVAVARRLSGLGNTTIWALIKSQKLEVVRIGRRTLIILRSLDAPRSSEQPRRCR
jgi:hypothetical protein